MIAAKYNEHPNVFRPCENRDLTVKDRNDSVIDVFDKREVFDLIKHITDPEHPLTLEQLRVVEEDLIAVDNEKNTINVYFTPTIPYCSLATLIGLSLRVKLMRSLPERFKVSVQITPGTHISEKSINKQLADKERIAAAIESKYLSDLINQCIALTPEEKDLPPLYDILRNDLEIAANLITPLNAKI